MISFSFIDYPVFKFERRKLKTFVKELIISEGFKIGDLSFNFCSDVHLLSVNKDYLNHDYFTDIITFDYSELNFVSGDLIVSVDRLKDNASKENVDFLDEFHRVCFHGVLHLCGYKDKSASDKVLMTSKEDFYLSKYNSIVSRETI